MCWGSQINSCFIATHFFGDVVLLHPFFYIFTLNPLHPSTNPIILNNNKARLLILNFPFVLAFKKKETGFYSLIGGNIEEHEAPLEALIREAKEEAGIKLTESDVTFVCTIHYQKEEVFYERTYFQLISNDWDFKLMEPKKFDRIEWIDFTDNQQLFKTSDQQVIKALMKTE